MTSPNTTSAHDEGSLLKWITGRVLNTLGVVLVAIGVAMAASQYEGISAIQRTIAGLLFAGVMVGIGQFVASRKNAGSKSEWFATTVISTGYGLAYFFVYATYYVKGLTVFETPYASWILAPVLGAIGTYHGTKNRTVRWFSVVFTALLTGHVLFQVLTSTATIAVAGLTLKVSFVGCIASVLWCYAMSVVYKREEGKFRWEGAATKGEAAAWLLNRVAHEVYFVGAAVSAAVSPLFQEGNLTHAPLYWSILTPLLLAATRRNANFVKHGVVAAMWAAAAITLISQGKGTGLENLLAVPLAGLAMGSAYRYLKTGWDKSLQLAGYAVYLYGAVAVLLVVPYLQFGALDAMPFWLIGALVLCGLSLALRDRFVHVAGVVAGAAGLALFFYQFHTWTWTLVVPVVLCAYGLSVAYSYIVRKKGWKQDAFLEPFGLEYTVTEAAAEKLEHAWSWVGCGIVLVSSLVLVDQSQTVFYWAVEGLALIALGFAALRFGYRLQGVAAIAAAIVKLIFWDLTEGKFEWNPDLAFTLFNSGKFAVVGLTALLASFLYFRDEAKAEALAKAASPTPTPDAPPALPASGTDTPPDVQN